MCPKVGAGLYLARWNKERHPKPQPFQRDKIRAFMQRAFLRKRCVDTTLRACRPPPPSPTTLYLRCPAGWTSLRKLRRPQQRNHLHQKRVRAQQTNPVAHSARIPPLKNYRTSCLGPRSPSKKSRANQSRSLKQPRPPPKPAAAEISLTLTGQRLQHLHPRQQRHRSQLLPPLMTMVGLTTGVSAAHLAIPRSLLHVRRS